MNILTALLILLAIVAGSFVVTKRFLVTEENHWGKSASPRVAVASKIMSAVLIFTGLGFVALMLYVFYFQP